MAALQRFCRALGLAFQFHDDVLGIWGAEHVTGKPAAGDILSKKKSLPVLHALAHSGVGQELRARYAGPPFTPGDVPAMLALLDVAGARAFSEARVNKVTAEAHQALRDAGSALAAGAQAPLHELLDILLTRQA